MISRLTFWRRGRHIPNSPEADKEPRSITDEAKMETVEPDASESIPPETKRVKWILSALLFTTVLIILRSIYRLDELSGYNGGSGTAYSNQGMFIAIDASVDDALAPYVFGGASRIAGWQEVVLDREVVKLTP